jgi:membrane protease YdiL (CAAX protease family)
MFLLAPVERPTLAGLGRFTGFPVTHVVVLALLLVVINGFGEETGWRGFLLPALERRFHPFGASIAVAAIWAAWHAPAFLINENYRAMPVVMLPMFFIGLVCGSVFLTWLHNRARQSIAVVAVWHGLFNVVTGTMAARTLLAPVETVAVTVIAAIIVVRELLARWRERHGQYADHVLAPG